MRRDVGIVFSLMLRFNLHDRKNLFSLRLFVTIGVDHSNITGAAADWALALRRAQGRLAC